MLSRKKLSRLVFRDNGLPDSYGILIDDIEVFDMGAHPNAENVQKDIDQDLVLLTHV